MRRTITQKIATNGNKVTIIDFYYYPTRYNDLVFAQIKRGEWSFFEVDELDRDEKYRIGPIYRSKAELLADLERFARERGFN